MKEVKDTKIMIHSESEFRSGNRHSVPSWHSKYKTKKYVGTQRMAFKLFQAWGFGVHNIKFILPSLFKISRSPSTERNSFWELLFLNLKKIFFLYKLCENSALTKMLLVRIGRTKVVVCCIFLRRTEMRLKKTVFFCSTDFFRICSSIRVRRNEPVGCLLQYSNDHSFIVVKPKFLCLMCSEAKQTETSESGAEKGLLQESKENGAAHAQKTWTPQWVSGKRFLEAKWGRGVPGCVISLCTILWLADGEVTG